MCSFLLLIIVDIVGTCKDNTQVQCQYEIENEKLFINITYISINDKKPT